MFFTIELEMPVSPIELSKTLASALDISEYEVIVYHEGDKKWDKYIDNSMNDIVDMKKNEEDLSSSESVNDDNFSVISTLNNIT